MVFILCSSMVHNRFDNRKSCRYTFASWNSEFDSSMLVRGDLFRTSLFPFTLSPQRWLEVHGLTSDSWRSRIGLDCLPMLTSYVPRDIPKGFISPLERYSPLSVSLRMTHPDLFCLHEVDA